MCVCVCAQVCERTHISAGEGCEDLELVRGVAFGGHEVEEHLQLAATQKPPHQELAAGRADAQLADGLSTLFAGLGR